MKQGNLNRHNDHSTRLSDYGPEPFVVNINSVTGKNSNYRTALWTGMYLQLTLMSIPVGEEIGLEVHPNTDQYIRIESGAGMVQMGSSKDKLNYQKQVRENDGIFVPAGTWHNVVNIGRSSMKISSVYAPPHHPHGTVQKTKAEADAEENHY